MLHKGLKELGTGIRCVDDFAACGRHKTEAPRLELVRQIHALIEPQS